jgi:hypothetical protein
LCVETACFYINHYRAKAAKTIPHGDEFDIAVNDTVLGRHEDFLLNGDWY